MTTLLGYAQGCDNLVTTLLCGNMVVATLGFLYGSVIMFLRQHQGVAPEEGAYSRDKKLMSDPAYKPPPPPPPTLSTALRLQKGGHICGTLRYYLSSIVFITSRTPRGLKTLCRIKTLELSLYAWCANVHGHCLLLVQVATLIEVH